MAYVVCAAGSRKFLKGDGRDCDCWQIAVAIAGGLVLEPEKSLYYNVLVYEK